ncbi:lamin tail domain-containing protein [bacterium]|nr:lamin tail domain-containing protein [bacterium]
MGEFDRCSRNKRRCCLAIMGVCTAMHLCGQVLINEIMFNPDGSEHTDEFVEIINTDSSLSVDLSGWTVHDGEDGDRIIEAGKGLILAPDQIGLILDADYFQKSDEYQALISKDALVLTVEGSTIGNGGLSNSRPECVMLINVDGQIVDSVRYDIGIASGHSYERVALDLPSCDPLNWRESHSVYGSPGCLNSVSPVMYDLTVVEMVCHPSSKKDLTERCFDITIRNAGKNPVYDAGIVLFEDVNRDSLPAESEAVCTCNIDALSAGDTTVVRLPWSAHQYGAHCMGIEIVLSSDEKPNNNRLFSDIWIPYPVGSLVINEIMADPLPDAPEWIELYHPQPYSIDLLGWYLSDEDTTHRYLISETSVCIPPKSYMILSESKNLPVSVSDALLIEMQPFPNFNNSQDGIFLFDPGLNVIDSVAYCHAWGGGKGVSLERIQHKGESNNSANWYGCISLEGMTPGVKNSVSKDSINCRATLNIDPNPFSPDGDGMDEVAFIQYRLPFEYATITLSLYDVQGRCIRHLRRGIESGGEGVVLWDGRDNSGRRARIGLYVVFLEVLDYASGAVIQKKTTVVLAGVL